MLRFPCCVPTLQADKPIAGPWVQVWWLPAILLMTGCAAVAPPAPPDLAATQQRYRQATGQVGHATQGQSGVSNVALDAATWDGFGDPLLVALVSHARSHNLDIRIAATRVNEARTGLQAAASRVWPTVSSTGSVSDQRTGLPDAVKQGSPDTRALRVGIELGWEIDVFGAARAAAEATALDAQAAEAGVQTAQWLITTEVARQYLVWQGARLRLQTLEALLQAQRDTERLTQSRESAGLASRFDVSRASAETQSLAAQLPPLRTLIAVTEHQIDWLLGSASGAPRWAWREGAHVRLPEVPLLAPGQPVELLQRRPDLRVAEQRLLAEAARLQEKNADRWPSFFLAAAVGRQDLRLNVLDLSPVRFSNVALAFTAPLFNAGRLKAAAQQQSSRAERATLEYEQAVLGAVRDVENSLVSLHEERQRGRALITGLQTRRTGLSHAESLHREGQIDMLQLLDAQRALLAAELAHIDSRTAQALGAVQLVSAMGGGWYTQIHSAAAPQPPVAEIPSSAFHTSPAPTASRGLQ